MSTMKQPSRRTVILGSLVAAAWVATAVPTLAQEGVPTMLSVDNARGVPVVVYLERGAYDTRLGTVAPHSRMDLALPVHFADGDRFSVTVHPEGGIDLYTQDKLVVHRGRPISLYVPTSNDGFVPAPPPIVIENPGVTGATLTVDNPSGRAAVVFIDGGMFDTRIGTVPARNSKTFELPASLTEGRDLIDVFVHMEGGIDLESNTFDLGPDAHLLVKIPT